jgi:hypothetical protein
MSCQKKTRTYVYRPVACTECSWRGRRGFNVTWPACPRCHAPGHKVKFVCAEDKGQEAQGVAA